MPSAELSIIRSATSTQSHTTLLATLDAAEARDDEATGAETAGAPGVARRLTFEHLAPSPAESGRPARPPRRPRLEQTHEAAHRVGRAVGE